MSQLGKFTEYFKALKKRLAFSVIDTHVHPFDVMGIEHFSEHKEKRRNGHYFFSPTLIERLHYGVLVNLLAPMYCAVFSGLVRADILKAFKDVSADRILAEMSFAGVDRCFLIPIEPWSRTADIAQNFSHQAFSVLGSIDIHQTPLELIEPSMIQLKKIYNAVGIKLHPNLQNFYPQPRNNTPEIGKKLSKIYEMIVRLKFYLLIHGGGSFYTENIDKRYGLLQRSRHKAVLKNFVNEDGSSELFEQYTMPVVISHLGHYGESRLDVRTIEIIKKQYPQVSFDTAGVAPRLIRSMLLKIGSNRIIFGSDALYNRMQYNLFFTHQAIRHVYRGAAYQQAFVDIFGANITRITAV